MQHYITYPSKRVSKATWLFIWKVAVLPPSAVVPAIVLSKQGASILIIAVITVVTLIIGYALIMLLMKVMYWLSKIELTRQEVSGMNYWGLRARAKWQHIDSAKVVDYGELKFLSLHSEKRQRRMYLPLFVDDSEELKAAVSTLAGENHPASLAIGGESANK